LCRRETRLSIPFCSSLNSSLVINITNPYISHLNSFLEYSYNVALTRVTQLTLFIIYSTMLLHTGLNKKRKDAV
jgi:hypothetical protein